MAFTHIHFDESLPYGRILRGAIRSNEQADLDLGRIISLLTTMIDGDGTSITHFDEVVSRFAFPSTTAAKAAWDELQSAYSKSSGNGSVSNVRAARDQLFAKLRG